MSTKQHSYRSVVALIAGMALSPASSHAQIGWGITSPVFLERGYIVRSVPRNGVMYEAQAAFHLYWYGTQAELFATLRQAPDDAKSPWSRVTNAVFSPMFQVRQLSSDFAASSPVRTPSFKPRIIMVQHLQARRADPMRSRSGEPRAYHGWVRGAQVGFAHYSNGQAGCFRANEVADAKGKCSIDPDAPAGSDTLNLIDGSFSTWFIPADLLVRRFRVGRNGIPEQALTLKAGIDWHPAAFEFFGGMDGELAKVYGRLRTRVELDVSQSICGGQARLRASYAAEKGWRVAEPVPTARHAFELALTSRRTYGAGLLARIHRGQDYYNIGLGRNLNVVQVGLVFDLERDEVVPAPRTASTAQP